MWWAIGAAIGLLLLWFLLRVRSFARRNALVNAGRGQLRVCLNSFSGFGDGYDPRVWTDPYMLGFMQGSIASMLHFFGRGLTVEQRGFIVMDIFSDVKPEGWRELCDRIEKLTQRRDPEFVRGMDHAGDVTGLTLNKLRPEVMAEPDIQEALLQAPVTERLVSPIFERSGEPAASPYASAGASLMSIYIERHRAHLDQRGSRD